MSTFVYEAMNAQNKMVRGSIDAMDRNAVMANLTRQGLKPLSLKIDTTGKKKKGELNLPFLKPKVKLVDLVLFTRQLSTMVSAGVPLMRALNTLQTQIENPALKEVVIDLVKEIQAGAQLGDAMAKHPDVFSDIFVNMVRAGEAAGILDDILKRLAVQVEKRASMRKKIKSASTYPMVLMILTVGAFFGMMIFIIPTIGQVLLDLGGPDAELPAMTQGMLALSDFMVNQWYIVFGGLGAAIFVFMRYKKTEKGTIQMSKIYLKIPILKTLIVKIAIASFTRTFAALIGAGVSVVEALQVTGRSLGNKLYEAEIERATKEVTNGKPLSEALDGSSLFPVIVPQMLAIGEETGQTDVVLMKVAEFYEEEVDATIDSLSSILEPVMIVIMGGMVGLLAANVMGPIASLTQNIG